MVGSQGWVPTIFFLVIEIKPQNMPNSKMSDSYFIALSKKTFEIFSLLLVLMTTTPAMAASPISSINKAYYAGDYQACVQEYRKIAADKVSNTARELAAECLFHLRKYQKAAEILLPLLNESPNLRVASRLADLYKLEPKIDPEPIVRFLETVKNENKFLAMQLQPTLVENGRLELFLRLYKKYPVYLNDQQWNLLLSQLGETQFNQVLEVTNRSAYDKKYIRARFYRFHNKLKEAENLLVELLDEQPSMIVILALAGLYRQQDRAADEQKALSRLKGFGARGYQKLAEYFFESSQPEKALIEIKEGLAKGYYLHELYVFYLFSAGHVSEAAKSLEEFKREKKISPYRYSLLMKQMKDSEKSDQLVSGLEMLLPKYPDVCEAIIKIVLSSEPAEKLTQRISSCPVYQNKFAFYVLLEKLLQEARYKTIELLMETQKARAQSQKEVVPLTPNEIFILGAARYHLGKYREAIGTLEQLKSKDDLSFKDRAGLLLAKSYLQVGQSNKAEAILTGLKSDEAFVLLLRLNALKESMQPLMTLLASGEAAKVKEVVPYFRALSLLREKKFQSAEKLLEDFLRGGGEFGNEAIYLIFILKYFPDSEERNDLLKVVSSWPYFSGSEKSYSCESIDSTLRAYTCHWEARRLIMTGQKEKARAILQVLMQSPEASLLRDENGFLLASLDKTNYRRFILRFPASPFRVLLKP